MDLEVVLHQTLQLRGLWLQLFHMLYGNVLSFGNVHKFSPEQGIDFEGACHIRRIYIYHLNFVSQRCFQIHYQRFAAIAIVVVVVEFVVVIVGAKTNVDHDQRTDFLHLVL